MPTTAWRSRELEMLAAMQVARDADRHLLSETGRPSQLAQQHHTPAAHGAARRRPHAAGDQPQRTRPAPAPGPPAAGARRARPTSPHPHAREEKNTRLLPRAERLGKRRVGGGLLSGRLADATPATQVVVGAGRPVGGSGAGGVDKAMVLRAPTAPPARPPPPAPRRSAVHRPARLPGGGPNPQRGSADREQKRVTMPHR